MTVYKALVEKVVDGDTLAVRIDLGFNVWVSQRIRFRGINTAELVKDGVKTGKAPDRAEQAKAFVEERLKDIEFIVIKTYKTDMYGCRRRREKSPFRRFKESPWVSGVEGMRFTGG